MASLQIFASLECCVASSSHVLSGDLRYWVRFTPTNRARSLSSVLTLGVALLSDFNDFLNRKCTNMFQNSKDIKIII